MKVEQSGNTVQSTMQGRSIPMQMAVGQEAHIMSILVNMYEDRLLAVLREYSTNAWDAHVEAGVSLPIEITLPQSLTPTLTIRDYGIGLSAEDIEQIYSQYGASTKRDTNAQTGMMGIGCKSGLTYGSQFTVSSVKDGERVIVLVSRDEEGGGSMDILDESLTTDANGTEVQISIRREDHDRCKELARTFFSYWGEGQVEINGYPSKPFHEDNGALKITDNLYITDEYGEDRVVMGNVSYPVKFDLGVSRNRYHTAFSVVAFVPIGSVKPAPSREALIDTKLTKDTLENVGRDFGASISGAIQREVDASATHADALRTIVRWAQYVPNSSKIATAYTYKGSYVPAAHVVGLDDAMFVTPSREGGRMSGGQHSHSIPAGEWPTIVWVENFEPAAFVGAHKKKLWKWSKDNKIGYKVQPGYNEPISDGTVSTFVMLRGKAPQSPFIDPSRVVAWSTIKAVKLPTSTRRAAYGGTSRIPGSFDLYTEEGVAHGVAGDKIRTDVPLFYIKGNTGMGYRHHNALQTLLPAYTLICLPSNRVDKFLRDVPTAVHVQTGAERAYAAWIKTVDPDDLRALALGQTGWENSYTRLDASRIDDPALKDAIRVSQRPINKLTRIRHTLRSVLEAPELNPDWTQSLAEYPLIDYSSINNHAEHVYLYINTLYAARQAGTIV
jgi:hypothetical protein